MRVLMNFQHREKWVVSFLAGDARTPVGRSFTVPDMETLLRVVERLSGDPERARVDVYNWGRGSVWVDLSESQRNYFGIVYITVDPKDHRIVVSPRIREEFSNGRDYYALHGKQLRDPVNILARPNPEYLEYHSSEVFR